jgi:hypothetical protein
MAEAAKRLRRVRRDMRFSGSYSAITCSAPELSLKYTCLVINIDGTPGLTLTEA